MDKNIRGGFKMIKKTLVDYKNNGILKRYKLLIRLPYLLLFEIPIKAKIKNWKEEKLKNE